MGGEIVALEYPACEAETPLLAWDGWMEADDEEADDAGPAQRIAEDATHGAGKSTRGSTAGGTLGDRVAEQTRQSFDLGREQGRQEGRQAEREAQAAALKAEQERYKRQVAGLVKRFAEESDRYLHAVEQEAVKLALAVAARVLRREAQMDPLLLTGAVRVALGQLAAASEVRMRVPAAEVELWEETIAALPKLAVKPVVVAGEGMHVGDCVIESKVGTVDLGVRSQLGEIERGFFDRAGISSEGAKASMAHESGAAPAAARQEVRV